MTLTIKLTTGPYDYYDTDPHVTLPLKLTVPTIKNNSTYNPLLIHLDTQN